jgi:hypothetical protein
MKSNRKCKIFWKEKGGHMRYFLHPVFETLSLWSKLHLPQAQNATDLGLVVSPGPLWPGGTPGRTHFAFEFFSESTGGKTSNWLQGLSFCSEDIHVPFPWATGRLQMKDTDNLIAFTNEISKFWRSKVQHSDYS